MGQAKRKGDFETRKDLARAAEKERVRVKLELREQRLIQESLAYTIMTDEQLEASGYRQDSFDRVRTKINNKYAALSGVLGMAYEYMPPFKIPKSGYKRSREY
jgi:hypothetical protein